MLLSNRKISCLLKTIISFTTCFVWKSGLVVCEDLSNVVETSALCDFKADCVDGSDERDCGG